MLSDRVRAGEGEHKFGKSVTVDASPERAWAALVDPFALSWMVARCVYTVPVPPRSAASADLRCWWRRDRNGELAGSVFEVAVIERHRRVRYLELAQPRSLRFEFTLEPEAKGCRVDVAGFCNQFGDPGMRVGSPKNLVRRMARRLPSAAFNGVGPITAAPKHLLDGAGDHPHEMVSQVYVSAPLDAIWAAADDPDGTVLNLPGVVRQWRTITAGTELFFSMSRPDSGPVTCSIAQVVYHAQHHVTVKGPLLEVEHRLVPDGGGGQLTTIHRWSRSLPVKSETMAKRANEWLSKVKAAAEGSISPA